MEKVQKLFSANENIIMKSPVLYCIVGLFMIILIFSINRQYRSFKNKTSSNNVTYQRSINPSNETPISTRDLPN